MKFEDLAVLTLYCPDGGCYALPHASALGHAVLVDRQMMRDQSGETLALCTAPLLTRVMLRHGEILRQAENPIVYWTALPLSHLRGSTVGETLSLLDDPGFTALREEIETAIAAAEAEKKGAN